MEKIDEKEAELAERKEKRRIELLARRAKEKLELAFDLGGIAARQKKPIICNPYSYNKIEREDGQEEEKSESALQEELMSAKWIEGYTYFKDNAK